jgi:hypothetical protein
MMKKWFENMCFLNQTITGEQIWFVKIFEIECKVQENFTFVEFGSSIWEELELLFLKPKFTLDDQIRFN